MALSFQQSAQLMGDLAFRGRVKVACLKYADSIMSSRGPQPGGNTLLKWAQQTFQQPDQVSMQVQPPTVMDAAVQGAGADITDDALQGAVEAVVNKML